MSEKRWLTTVGAAGVPQSKRVSDRSGAACAGASRVATAPAHTPADSRVKSHCIFSSLKVSDRHDRSAWMLPVTTGSVNAVSTLRGLVNLLRAPCSGFDAMAAFVHLPIEYSIST